MVGGIGYILSFFMLLCINILKVCVAQGLDCTLNELWSKGKGKIFTFFLVNSFYSLTTENTIKPFYG